MSNYEYEYKYDMPSITPHAVVTVHQYHVVSHPIDHTHCSMVTTTLLALFILFLPESSFPFHLYEAR